MSLRERSYDEAGAGEFDWDLRVYKARVSRSRGDKESDEFEKKEHLEMRLAPWVVGSLQAPTRRYLGVMWKEANSPSSTSKGWLRRVFGPLGSVVDIFISRRSRNHSPASFAFIRTMCQCLKPSTSSTEWLSTGTG